MKQLLMGIAILLSAVPLQATDVTDTLTLREVVVNASFSSPRNSPLRLTTIDSETLQSRAASRTYPELLKAIPGVYATAETVLGSSRDYVYRASDRAVREH